MFDDKNNPKPDPSDRRTPSETTWDTADNSMNSPEFGRDEQPTLAEEIQHSDFAPRDLADDRTATQVRHDGVGPTDYSDSTYADTTRSFAATQGDDLTDDQRTATLGAPAGTAYAAEPDPYAADADPYAANASRYETHPEERFVTGAVPPGDNIGDATTAHDEEPGVAKHGFHLPKFGGLLLGLMRILIGWKLLWDFLDKTFGLGFATPSSRAWINGGSPSEGYLSAVVKDPNNPFSSMFQYFLDQAWTDWVFMGGLLGIGVVLILGLGKTLTWIAALSGIAMMALLYLAAWPPGHSAGAVGSDGQAANNPFFDIHILIALALLIIAVANASAYLGLAKAWRTRRIYQD